MSFAIDQILDTTIHTLQRILNSLDPWTHACLASKFEHFLQIIIAANKCTNQADMLVDKSSSRQEDRLIRNINEHHFTTGLDKLAQFAPVGGFTGSTDQKHIDASGILVFKIAILVQNNKISSTKLGSILLFASRCRDGKDLGTLLGFCPLNLVKKLRVSGHTLLFESLARILTAKCPNPPIPMTPTEVSGPMF